MAPIVAQGHIVKRTTTLTTDIVATTTVTPTGGGWIWIQEAGLIVYFPAGAVSSDLVVTAVANQGNKVVYTFEPHGTVFQTPIYVAQYLVGTELYVNTQMSTQGGGKSNKQHNKTTTSVTYPDIWAGYLECGLNDINADGTGNFTETFNAFLYGKNSGTLAVFTTTHFSGYALASGARVPVGQ